MFWKLKSKSCRIKLQKVKTISEFEALLNSLAAEIWNECQYHHCVPDQFSCDHIPLDETQGVAFIANGLQKYIRDLECGSYGVSFMVYSEYDIQEYGDEELADRISNFFFLKSVCVQGSRCAAAGLHADHALLSSQWAVLPVAALREPAAVMASARRGDGRSRPAPGMPRHHGPVV